MATSSSIATAPEPWILLPLIYARRPEGVYSEYDQSLSSGAVSTFARGLRGGERAYDDELRAFVERLYERAGADGTRYFVDKTPRYSLIVDDVIALFPDAKFVFLWRNPLAVAASIMDSFAGGRWNLHFCKIDLYEGLDKLVTARTDNVDHSHALRYEDLVADPMATMAGLGAYLDVEFAQDELRSFNDVRLEGLGDPTGIERYHEVSAESVHAWRSTMANPLRKQWCKRYVRWIGASRLASMGYDLDELVQSLDEVATTPRFIASDIARRLYGATWSAAEPGMLRDKARRLRERRRLYPHP
jgi:hypothetical protein